MSQDIITYSYNNICVFSDVQLSYKCRVFSLSHFQNIRFFSKSNLMNYCYYNYVNSIQGTISKTGQCKRQDFFFHYC